MLYKLHENINNGENVKDNKAATKKLELMRKLNLKALRLEKDADKKVPELANLRDRSEGLQREIVRRGANAHHWKKELAKDGSNPKARSNLALENTTVADLLKEKKKIDRRRERVNSSMARILAKRDRVLSRVEAVRNDYIGLTGTRVMSPVRKVS
jgi:hypothetical protein